MPTYAWVVLDMLIAGIGGALATWGSMLWMNRGLEPQPGEVLGNLAALGGVLAGLCGGVASIGRVMQRKREDFPTALATLGLGIGVSAFISPALLFSPLLLVVAPVQGLAALLGGFAALGVFWAVLRFAEARGELRLQNPRGVTPASPLKASPLKTIALIAIAAGLVLPWFPSPESLVLSYASFYGGILLYGAALFLRRMDT